MSSLKVEFDIQSYWHIGSGESGGAYADSLVLKNKLGLPYLPGRSVKGLLRNAYEIAYSNNWFGSESYLKPNEIFGEEGESTLATGKIRVSNACLSSNETQFFIENPNAFKHAYCVHFNTAIDKETGVAIEGSLRSIEVSLPMKLTTYIELKNLSKEQEKIGLEAIAAASLLITEVGLKRSRGYGTVKVTAEIE